MYLISTKGVIVWMIKKDYLIKTQGTVNISKQMNQNNDIICVQQCETKFALLI